MHRGLVKIIVKYIARPIYGIDVDQTFSAYKLCGCCHELMRIRNKEFFASIQFLLKKEFFLLIELLFDSSACMHGHEQFIRKGANPIQPYTAECIRSRRLQIKRQTDGHTHTRTRTHTQSYSAMCYSYSI